MGFPAWFEADPESDPGAVSKTGHGGGATTSHQSCMGAKMRAMRDSWLPRRSIELADLDPTSAFSVARLNCP
jgi:hypothetical protein